MANRSQPIPQLIGSTTVSTIFAAMAASIAVPARANACAPACDASVWLVATIPSRQIVMDLACHRDTPGSTAVSILLFYTGAEVEIHRLANPRARRLDHLTDSPARFLACAAVFREFHVARTTHRLV